MAVTISVRFPHGRYHATAWDSSANSGDVEWPPSPWRLARALISVWYTRMRHIDEEVLDEVLDLFREPPRYWLPPVSSEHTRHYMPQREHRADAWATTLTLDAAVRVDPSQPIVITWPDLDASPRVREALAALVASLPYLGRAESICEAALLPSDGGLPTETADKSGWCEPQESGTHRLLCLNKDTTRGDLEARPDEVRRGRRLTPPGARWVAYTSPVRAPDERDRDAHVESQRHMSPSMSSRPEVLRWRLMGSVPFLAENGLAAVEGLRALRLSRFDKNDGSVALHGHRELDEAGRPLAYDNHQSAHWLWLEGDSRPDRGVFSWVPGVASGDGRAPTRRLVRDLALWMPGGVDPAHLADLIGGGLLRPRGWSPSGYHAAELQLVAIGSAEECLPEVVTGAGSTGWVSATPFLSVRHRRRHETFEEFLAADVRREWARRQPPGDAPEIVEVSCLDRRFDDAVKGRAWTARYRTRRWLATGGAGARRAQEPVYEAMVRVRFDRPVTGPIVLGGLSHFGFGLFMPMGRV